MDFGLTKEEALIQKMAKEYAEKTLAPLAKQIDKENEVPAAVLEELRDLELMGIPFKEDYGGAGGGYVQYVLALEQLAKECSGLAVIVSAHCLSLSALDAFGSEEQKKQFMTPACQGQVIASFAFTEPGTGSDPKQITTTAVRDGDCYILNGTKRFISNGTYPGPMVAFAKEADSGNVSAFVVDKFCAGYSVSEPWEKIGMRGSHLVDVYLKDVKVPAENLLGRSGQGYAILQYGISFGKIGICTCALGAILACLEESVSYAKTKTHREQPIAKFQAIQLKIADLEIKYQAAQLLAYRLAYLAERVKDPTKFAQQSALSKCAVTDLAVQAARLAVDIHGSYGLMDDYKVSRVWRDVAIGPQIEGVNDMQRLIVAATTLR